jgi:hypothetical protein
VRLPGPPQAGPPGAVAGVENPGSDARHAGDGGADRERVAGPATTWFESARPSARRRRTLRSGPPAGPCRAGAGAWPGCPRRLLTADRRTGWAWSPAWPWSGPPPAQAGHVTAGPAMAGPNGRCRTSRRQPDGQPSPAPVLRPDRRAEMPTDNPPPLIHPCHRSTSKREQDARHLAERRARRDAADHAATATTPGPLHDRTTRTCRCERVG